MKKMSTIFESKSVVDCRLSAVGRQITTHDLTNKWVEEWICYNDAKNRLQQRDTVKKSRRELDWSENELERHVMQLNNFLVAFYSGLTKVFWGAF